MRTRTLAVAALLWSGAVWAETLEPIGVFDLETESIKGVSGLEVSDTGDSFIAVSDGGWWLEGRFERRGDVMTGVEITAIEPISGHDGFPVSARRVGDWSDAEGLALAPEGTAWVTFERWAHVWRFGQGAIGDPRKPGSTGWRAIGPRAEAVLPGTDCPFRASARPELEFG